MWLRLSKILLLCLLPLKLCAATAADGNRQWQGSVRLENSVQVASGETLRIAAGSRIEIAAPEVKITVQGVLLSEGTETEPVVFASPPGWQGIEFIEAAAGSRIVHSRFADCQQAISIIATSPLLSKNHFSGCGTAIQLLRESQAEISSNRFDNNQVGLKVGMRSQPQISNNHFSGQQAAVEISSGSSGTLADNSFTGNQYGIAVQRQFKGVIRANRFEANKVAIYNYQTRNTPLIEANSFLRNEQGIVAFLFSYPAVRENRFIDNGTAISNDQFGSTLIEHNLFRGNQTAIHSNRKSNPQIGKNLFEENGLALYFDYSSYPQVAQNNFLANRRAVELGSYQSADWEQRVGSQQLVQQQARERNSRNPLLSQAPSTFEDRVDVSNNWWGEQTEVLEEAGADANLEFFFDRHDKPLVSYPGYGAEQYRLDLITYAPWLNQPVADAGPQESP